MDPHEPAGGEAHLQVGDALAGSHGFITLQVDLHIVSIRADVLDEDGVEKPDPAADPESQALRPRSAAKRLELREKYLQGLGLHAAGERGIAGQVAPRALHRFAEAAPLE